MEFVDKKMMSNHRLQFPISFDLLLNETLSSLSVYYLPSYHCSKNVVSGVYGDLSYYLLKLNRHYPLCSNPHKDFSFSLKFLFLSSVGNMCCL